MGYNTPPSAVPGTIITAADHNTYVKENIIYLKEHENPTGAIIAFGGSAAPAGWLLCDGTAASRTGQAALFAVIGTTYGAGNGTTTFNVPDLRSRFPIGAGTGSGLTTRARGSSGGEESHTLTEAELTTHNHGVGAHVHNLKSFNYDPPTTSSPTFPIINQIAGSTGSITTEGASGATDTTNTGDGDPFPIMNPFLAVNYIIKV